MSAVVGTNGNFNAYFYVILHLKVVFPERFSIELFNSFHLTLEKKKNVLSDYCPSSYEFKYFTVRILILDVLCGSFSDKASKYEISFDDLSFYRLFTANQNQELNQLRNVQLF